MSLFGNGIDCWHLDVFLPNRNRKVRKREREREKQKKKGQREGEKERQLCVDESTRREYQP